MRLQLQTIRCFSEEQPPKLDKPCDVVQGPNLLRTAVHRPSPSLMFLPGLRSLPFWTSVQGDENRVAYGDPVVTSAVEYLQANVETIRNEYLSVVAMAAEDKKLASDYTDTGHQQQLHQGKWEWHSYLNKGSVQGHFAFHFPETAKILQELRQENLLFEGTPFGFCFFSSLHGNSSIQPHTSPMNLRLRVHLPLIVPKEDPADQEIKCGIQVGPIARQWKEGKALVLDDAYQHEVWNKTDQLRVLLLVDMWHPDITIEERKEIVKMFQDARQQGMWKR
jgi:aspartyl/asparaginyl beta-hydroxylase (cupin superfamily)